MKKMIKGKYYRLDYSDYEDNYILVKFKNGYIYFYWQASYFKKCREVGKIDYSGYSVTHGCKIRLATEREVMQTKLLLMIKEGSIK